MGALDNDTTVRIPVLINILKLGSKKTQKGQELLLYKL